MFEKIKWFGLNLVGLICLPAIILLTIILVGADRLFYSDPRDDYDYE